MPDDDRYTLRVGEVATRLGVSRETVHNLAESGVLPYIKRPHGRQEWKYFAVDEVTAYAQARGVRDR